MIEPKTI